MVVDLRASVQPDYHLLKRHTGVRVHIDLGVPGSAAAGIVEQKQAAGKQRSKPLRDVIVAIDAGHGGIRAQSANEKPLKKMSHLRSHSDLLEN